MSDISFKRIFRFPPNRVGYLAKYVEPISAFLEEEHIRAMFEQDPDLESIPVEQDGGVGSLVTRDSCLHPEHRRLSFKQRTALDLARADIPAIGAMESLTTVVTQLLESGFRGDFLVFHGNRYLGVASVREVLLHSASLQAQDMEQAKRVQDNFMYISPETDTRMQFSWFNQMAHEVGGDFIQWRRIDPDTWVLGIFDLAGKGVSAALSTSLIAAYFTTLELTGVLVQERPQRIIQMLHQLMQRTLIEDSFVVCAFVFCDLKESAVRIYNCGLGPMYAFQASGAGKLRHLRIDPNLPPLGFEGFPQDKLVPARLKWTEGMKLFICTDGLADMRNPEGHQYGEEAVEEFLIAHGADTGPDLKKNCIDLVHNYIAQAPQADDLTFAVLEWPGCQQ